MDIDLQQELDEKQREVVANRLLAEQRERFDGVQKMAYIEAGVNPETWKRATAGLRVRPDRLMKIVKSLWPQSGGLWEKVPAEKSLHENPIPNHDIGGRFDDLERRVRHLEQQVTEILNPDDVTIVTIDDAESL